MKRFTNEKIRGKDIHTYEQRLYMCIYFFLVYILIKKREKSSALYIVQNVLCKQKSQVSPVRKYRLHTCDE